MDDKKDIPVATISGQSNVLPDVLGVSVAVAAGEYALTQTEPLPEKHDSTPPDPAALSHKEKVFLLLKNKGFQMCPVALFFGIATGIYGPVFTELQKNRVCQVLYNFSESYCANIGRENNTAVANDVRSTTADYVLYNNLVAGVPSIIFTLFMGAWSDQFGRRIPMMSVFVGMILSSGFLILFSYIVVHPGILLVATAVSAILGGQTIFVMSTLSYISDYTTNATRAILIAIFTGFMGLGTALGPTIGTNMLPFGFAVPFYVFLGMHTTGLIFVYFRVKDHDKFPNNAVLNERLPTLTYRLQKIFNVQGLKDNWNMLRRSRPNRGRLLVITTLIGYSAATMCLDTETTILQLFVTFKPLSWSVQQYGNFATALGVTTCVVLSTAIPIFKDILKIRESTMGVIASVSAIMCAFCFSQAVQSWVMFLALGLGVFRPLMAICLQSALIGLVSQLETGKMGSLIGIIQAVCLVLSSGVFVKVFGATAGWWPGFIFAVESVVLLLPLGAFCCADYVFKRSGVVRNDDKEAILSDDDNHDNL